MVDAAVELDSRIGAFESAWAAGAPDLSEFLPSPDDSLFLPCLTELIRVDLEFRRKRGQAARLQDYEASYADLFDNKSIVRELAFEEYRLRIASGEAPNLHEYEDRYGIDTRGWPVPSRFATTTDNTVGRYPQIGETINDFELIEELGRGSFARVYLAQQRDLGGRPVALKVSTKFRAGEPETLARLQHTHIVPIYSAHRSGPFELIVMPFLGATTLADLLGGLHKRSTWPASGQALADTIEYRNGKALPTLRAATDFHLSEDSRRDKAGVVWRKLSRFAFDEAVLWIGARLAEALAHAHDRGILHRDVKPGNVLLTDDGQPMLLDFNLAASTSQIDSKIGGTPAYMAPEQLKSIHGEAAVVDARSDVYSLGLVLFEVMTARQPFALPSPLDPKKSVLELIKIRSQRPLNPRSFNQSISPSSASILLKCLEPDPAKRYQSAAALAEDLNRQLNHLPLLHAPEPSWPVRFQKWRRRHPRLTSSGSVAAIAAMCLVALLSLLVTRHEQIRRLELEQTDLLARQSATDKFQSFRRDAQIAYPMLTIHNRDSEKSATGERQVHDLLQRYKVIDNSEWTNDVSVTHLPDVDRLGLRAQVADMLMTLARVRADRAMNMSTGPQRDAELQSALSVIDRAQAAYPPDLLPRSVTADRAELLAHMGKTVELVEPQGGPATAVRDIYLIGTAALARGNYREAARSLEDAALRDPRQFWVWFNLGVAYMGLGDQARAEGCFNAAIAIEPDHPAAHFNRGLTKLNRGLNAGAETDFGKALDLKPDFKDALINRGMARMGLSRFADAESDFTSALKFEPLETRLFFLRANAREKLGNTAGANLDREELLSRTPGDERSWITRGLARAPKDPQGALADFDQAIELNPKSVPALQNKASVLADQPGQTQAAIALLTTALEQSPDSLPTLAGRAVLLARMGDRAAAHRDADRCVEHGPTPDINYQLAGVYALTSTTNSEDARTAYRFLADALRLGYGFEHIDNDQDLKPIRDTEEFKKIVTSARELQGRSGRS
ncbi:MAG: protein kinase domain-containing protein [Gemmataceae bacterium]